tara:strand:+ start:490 stop:789 length:300 start_codon:yes stop_codon:yes gene_type:complete
LKAKISHPKKQIFLISDLTFIKKNPYPNTLDEDKRDNWMTDGMNEPIEVIKHGISPTPRKGSGGTIYIEKQYSIKRGSSRINYALANGYDAIEGIIINE